MLNNNIINWIVLIFHSGFAQIGFCWLGDDWMHGTHLIVRQCVVVEEQTRRNIESDKDIDRIVLVGSQYEEDSEHIQQPR